MQSFVQEYLDAKSDANYNSVYTKVTQDIEQNCNNDSTIHSAFIKLLCRLLKQSSKEKILACMICDYVSAGFLDRFQKSAHDLIQALYVTVQVIVEF